jgi:hypothetical protein
MIPGAEAFLPALIIYLLVLCMTYASVAVAIAGIICLIFKKGKIGIAMLVPSTIFLSIVFGFWLHLQPKKHAVFLDLTKPLEKRGIPSDTRWLKQNDYGRGDYWICEVNGKVSLTVILPDEKRIEEKVSSIIAFYGTNGFYDIQIDNYKNIGREQAVERIDTEAQKWSPGASIKPDIQTQVAEAKKWILEPEVSRHSFCSGIYCLRQNYSISSVALHDYLDQQKFSWRYSIRMAEALPTPVVR